MLSHTTTLKCWTTVLGFSLGALMCLMAFIIWQDTQRNSANIQHTIEAENIRIVRDGFPDIELIKRQENWHAENPCSIIANTQRLTPLLNTLTPAAHQYTASEVDLEAAGLLQPQASVFLNGTEHRIGNTDLNG